MSPWVKYHTSDETVEDSLYRISLLVPNIVVASSSHDMIEDVLVTTTVMTYQELMKMILDLVLTHTRKSSS